jgi:hypothetical protein
MLSLKKGKKRKLNGTSKVGQNGNKKIKDEEKPPKLVPHV